MRKDLSWIAVFLAFIDFCIVAISYRLVFFLKFSHSIPAQNWNAFIRILPIAFLATGLCFYIFNLYTGLKSKSVLSVLYSLFLAMVIVTVVTMGYSYISGNSALPRSIALITPVVELSLFSILRITIMILSKRIGGNKTLLLVGNSALETMEMRRKFAGHNISAFLSLDKDNKNKLLEKINEVDVVAMSSEVKEQMSIVNLCMKKGKEVLIVPDMMGILIFSAETQFIDDTMIFALKSPGLTTGQRFVKRGFDLVVALLMLLVASPVMILLLILIPVLSPGPAIFKQERLGENGLPYNVMKFRTMVNDAEKTTGPVLATESDPRITKFGAFLRATRLDELPQIINVLIGDMSVVGPRPERKFFVDQFKETIPYYSYRMTVKPGITGFAQVKGKYTTTPEDKLRFDLMYIRNYSFGLDLSILLQTVRVVFQREKAAGVEVNLEAGMKKMLG